MKIILNTPQVLRLLKRIQDENPNTQISLYGLASEITQQILDNPTGTTSNKFEKNYTLVGNKISHNHDPNNL
jgi:hypothetical protein